MINIALVDDDRKCLAETSGLIQRAFEELNEPYQIQTYDSSLAFLSKYHGEFDLIVLDISMPGMDGMELAKNIRERDNNVSILFVTTMSQYALYGYEVEAVGFLIKPVTYFSMMKHMKRVLARSKSKEKYAVTISTKQSTTTLATDSILYIEVRLHNLIFHTGEGEVQAYGTLSDLENELRPYAFSRCSNAFLVNLKYVTAVNGDTVKLGDTDLRISRTKKKQFIDDFIAYIEKR